MAMKDLNNVTPKTNDNKWREDIVWGSMPKRNTWYHFRLVGGVYSVRQHWITFINKEGKEKQFALGCRNWNPDTDAVDLDNDCSACDANCSGQVRYLINAIDRTVQQQMKAGVSPIRGLDLPPTLVREIQSLDKINVHDSKPMPVTHPDFGCDVYLQLNDQNTGNGKPKWIVQKGNSVALTAEEREYELYAFDEIYKLPDADKMRADLQRIGIIKNSANAVATAPVTTVQVPVQTESAPVTSPMVATPATIPITPVQVTPPTVVSPVVTTPLSVTPPVASVVTPPIAVTPPVTTSPVTTTPIIETTQIHTNLPVTSTVTPIAVTPPAVVSPVEQTTEVVGETPSTDTIQKPECFPDENDPSKRYLGKLKCVQCNFKQPCINASGN